MSTTFVRGILRSFKEVAIVVDGGLFYFMSKHVHFGCKFESSPFSAPDSAGVYYVLLINSITKKEDIIYVGTSSKMRSRIMNVNHPYRIAYNFTCENEEYLVCIYYYETDDRLSLEKKLINSIKPIFNKNL